MSQTAVQTPARPGTDPALVKPAKPRCKKCRSTAIRRETLFVCEGAMQAEAFSCVICGTITTFPVQAPPPVERAVARARAPEPATKVKVTVRPAGRVGENIRPDLRQKCGVVTCDNWIQRGRNKSGMCLVCAKRMRRWQERGRRTPVPFVAGPVEGTFIENPERAAARQEKEGGAQAADF